MRGRRVAELACDDLEPQMEEWFDLDFATTLLPTIGGYAEDVRALITNEFEVGKRAL